ncbi:MAG: hypothetical protein OIF57_17455 [Marinobacterium sp.]|nr:hypothetical protein [Marinobacterium sp.]
MTREELAFLNRKAQRLEQRRSRLQRVANLCRNSLNHNQPELMATQMNCALNSPDAGIGPVTDGHIPDNWRKVAQAKEAQNEACRQLGRDIRWMEKRAQLAVDVAEEGNTSRAYGLLTSIAENREQLRPKPNNQDDPF